MVDLAKTPTIPQSINVMAVPGDNNKQLNDYIKRWDEIYRYLGADLANLFANFLRRDGTSTLTGNWAVGGFDITGVKDLEATGYVKQGKIWHAYGGFQDAATTIAIGVVNTWYHITNATNDLWTGLEADGITLSGDVMTFVNAGDYTGVVTLDLSALLNKDYHVRVCNVTTGLQVGYFIAVSTTGANNNVGMTLPLYIEAAAGDQFQLEIECTTSATNVVVDNAVFHVTYLHD